MLAVRRSGRIAELAAAATCLHPGVAIIWFRPVRTPSSVNHLSEPHGRCLGPTGSAKFAESAPSSVFSVLCTQSSSRVVHRGRCRLLGVSGGHRPVGVCFRPSVRPVDSAPPHFLRSFLLRTSPGSSGWSRSRCCCSVGRCCLVRRTGGRWRRLLRLLLDQLITTSGGYEQRRTKLVYLSVPHPPVCQRFRWGTGVVSETCPHCPLTLGWKPPPGAPTLSDMMLLLVFILDTQTCLMCPSGGPKASVWCVTGVTRCLCREVIVLLLGVNK